MAARGEKEGKKKEGKSEKRREGNEGGGGGESKARRLIALAYLTKRTRKEQSEG